MPAYVGIVTPEACFFTHKTFAPWVHCAVKLIDVALIKPVIIVNVIMCTCRDILQFIYLRYTRSEWN